MSKYVIKNCSNISVIDFWRLDKNKLFYCKLNKCGCENYTDCVLKKIVEKCRDSKFYLQHYGHPENDGVKNYTLAKELLDMLEIEECE